MAVCVGLWLVLVVGSIVGCIVMLHNAEEAPRTERW